MALCSAADHSPAAFGALRRVRGLLVFSAVVAVDDFLDRVRLSGAAAGFGSASVAICSMTAGVSGPALVSRPNRPDKPLAAVAYNHCAREVTHSAPSLNCFCTVASREP
jgi:hypothetical protein